MGAQPEMFRHGELPDRIGLHHRDDGTVLVTGPHPGGLLLSGLTPAETKAVLGLNAAMRAPARSRTAPSARWAGVLTLIHRAAARLSPVTTAHSRVVVLGDGPLPEEIRRALAPIVTRVVTESEALAALQADATIHAPDLVVIPAIDAVGALSGRIWHARGVPQIPVVVSGDTLSVGPLIRPDTGPCLNCLDVHRGLRDTGWASWLAVHAVASGDRHELDAIPELRIAAAALTTFMVSGYQLDRALPPGISLSVERPHPRVHHHLWTRHPSCCGPSGPGVTMDE